MRLLDLTRYCELWGSADGRAVGERLSQALAHRATATAAPVAILDMEGMTRLDVPAAREAIINPARAIWPRVGLVLINVADQDIADNIDGAAVAVGWPIFCWDDTQCQIVGPRPSTGARAALNLLLSNGTITTGEVARSLGVSIPGAGNKLAQLALCGYALRRATEGKDYEYLALKPLGENH